MKTSSTYFTLVLLVLALACSRKESSPAVESAARPAADSLAKKMITAKVFVKPEYVASFLEVAKTLIDSSNAEPGCEGYMLYQNPYDNTKLIFVENLEGSGCN